MSDEQDDLGLGRLYRPADPKPGGLEEVVARGGRRRRRWVGGGLAVAVVVAAVAVVAAWPGSNGPEQVRVGDGAAVSTTTVATQPGSGTTVTIQVGSGAMPGIPQAPTTTTPGAPTCDAATISAGLVADLGANAANELVTFGCAGSYAYAEVTVPPPASAAPGTPGIGETLLLMASGSAWAPASQSTYCPSGSVPSPVYQFACGSN